MPQFSVCLLSIFLSLFSTLTNAIEKSFLQNNPQSLYSLLSAKNSIQISLPEPISFSDQVSRQQAYFFFKKIFQTFKTFEFYPEEEFPAFAEQGISIYKVRWSFIHIRNNNQYVFQIFFYIQREAPLPDRSKKARTFAPSAKILNLWKITEIKAEKL